MPIAPSRSESDLPMEIYSIELVHADGSCSVVDRDMLRIGMSEICEIQLASGPLLHSVIHNEAGVVWIEADADALELLVNGRNCRRMALRDGDVIDAAGLRMTLRFRTVMAPEMINNGISGLSQMSADQLCDRILEEQTEVDAFESATRQGWQNLMAAMRAVHGSNALPEEMPTVEETTDECERLLDQIRELSEMMNGRTEEIAEREAELAAATTLLNETHDRVSLQIEELLEQFGEIPHTGEMRASA